MLLSFPGAPVSAARDLFLEVPLWRQNVGEEGYDKLICAANLWREASQHFSAGVAMLDAFDASWGRADDRMLQALRAALMDFRHVILAQPPGSPASIAALYKLRQYESRISWFDD